MVKNLLTYSHSESQRNFAIQKKDYDQFMKDLPDLNITDFLKELNDARIKYEPTFFVPKMLIEFVDQLKDGRIINLKVRLSYFIFELQIYDSDSQSKIEHHLHKLGKRSFGVVYKFYVPKKKQFAIKRIQIEEKQKLSSIKKTLQLVIREYCIYKLASCFQISTKVVCQFGFDLIVFEDGIQFTLQLCESPSSSATNSMKRQLKYLHSLKIVHAWRYKIRQHYVQSILQQKCIYRLWLQFPCLGVNWRKKFSRL